MSLQVVVRGVERLPHSAQIRPAVGRARRPIRFSLSRNRRHARPEEGDESGCGNRDDGTFESDSHDGASSFHGLFRGDYGTVALSTQSLPTTSLLTFFTHGATRENRQQTKFGSSSSNSAVNPG